MVATGYGGLSLVYTHSYNHHSALAPATLNLLSGVGNSGAFTAAMNAQAKSFSGSQRGSATALVLAGFGLSAFMYSTLSHELFPGNTSDFLLLLAFGSAASFLLGIALIRILPEGSDSRSTTTDESAPSRPRDFTRRRTSSDLGARAYLSDDGLPEDLDDDEDEEQQPRADEHSHSERAGLLHGDSADARSQSHDSQVLDVTGRKLLKRPDFQLLFLIMCLISGSGLLLINNVGTITRTLWKFNHSLPPPSNSTTSSPTTITETIAAVSVGLLKADENAAIQQEQAHQVSAISIGNASGRVLIGFLSDLWVNYIGSTRQRVWLLLPVTLLAFSSQILFALPSTIDSVHRLLYASTLTGLMYGGFHGIAPCLTFEWFGLRHAARNWSLVALAPVISGNVFNLLFGKVFDSHVPKTGPSHQCLEGEECYRTAFLVTSAATAGSVVIALVLIVRRGGLAWRDNP